MTFIFEKYSTTKNTSFNQKTLISCLMITVFLIGCSSSAPQILSMEAAKINTKPATKQTDNNNTQGLEQKGMNVYIDPQTGEFISEPKQGQNALKITPEMQNATSTSSEGLVEEKSAVPGGGVMIDLKGRFQSPLIITQNPAGKKEIQHLNDFSTRPPQQPANTEKQGSGHEQK